MPEVTTEVSPAQALIKLQSALIDPVTRSPLSFAEYSTPKGRVGVCNGAAGSWVITEQNGGAIYRYDAEGNALGGRCDVIIQAIAPRNFLGGAAKSV